MSLSQALNQFAQNLGRYQHPGLLALMRPTSGTIPGRPRRRGRRETARRVPISAGNPENSTSVTVESRRPGLLPPVCCADGSPP